MNGDLLWNDVALLINGNGEPNSNTIVEETGKAAIAQNGAMYKDTHDLCGGTALYLPGGTGRVYIPDHPSFNIGGNDFCIEAILIPLNIDGTTKYIISQVHSLSNNANREFAVGLSTSAINLYYSPDGYSDINISVPCSLSNNELYAVEINKHAGTLFYFVNHQLIGTQPHTASMFNSTADLCIGTFGRYAEDGYTALSLNAYLAGLRLTNGSSRHTETFTGAALPLPVGLPSYAGAGIAKFADGAIAEAVKVWDASTYALLDTITPDPETGSFQVDVIGQTVYLCALRPGYRPIMHGPVTLTG